MFYLLRLDSVFERGAMTAKLNFAKKPSEIADRKDFCLHRTGSLKCAWLLSLSKKAHLPWRTKKIKVAKQFSFTPYNKLSTSNF
jgi:hypothetical protein